VSAPATVSQTTSKTAALQTHALCCGYDGIQVVHDLELAIEPGEIVAMLGANGAGKSTTLLTLAGVLPPIAGSVTLHGRPAGGSLQRRVRAGLGLLKETSSVFPTLTVAQNLALGRGSVDRAFEIAPELRPLARRRGGLLSGGEQRILATARALAAEPTVLLVDELSLGLAPKITDHLLALLRSHADAGTAVLLVEQHPRKALALADRVIVLRRGTIVLESPASELRDHVDDLHDSYFGS
jgi:ABC-type branched-subunit amino acid transport system ATPase component